MYHNSAHMLIAAACLALVSCSNAVDPVDQAVDANSPEGETARPDDDVNILEGRWSGSWGGGAQGDVVFQPVLAKLVIEGDHVELSGFPDAEDLTGTIRYDTEARRIAVTAAGSQVLEYTYDVSGDQLTLTAADGRMISMLKQRDVQVDRTDEGVPEP